jgi:hypothetical protein
MELKSTQPNQIKFTDEEVKELVALRNTYDQITVELGRIELQKRDIKKSETMILDRLSFTETSEKTFLDRIVAKYGEGNYDNETGIFTPKKV